MRGSYRWDNKILIAHDGCYIVYNKAPVTKSVRALVLISRPENSQLGKRRAVPELQKVKVNAYIIGIGKEEDQDYHLILGSTTGHDSLIAEIPDPSCTKLKGYPNLVRDYSAARKFIEDNIDPTPGKIHYLDARMKVLITGVVFFDKMAHGNGHAKNGVEIHPVLKIARN